MQWPKNLKYRYGIISLVKEFLYRVLCNVNFVLNNFFLNKAAIVLEKSLKKSFYEIQDLLRSYVSANQFEK